VRIVASGDGFEGNQSMTAPSARAERDAELRRALADPSSAHLEAAAAAEIDRSYADSGLVMGDTSELLAPGELLPGTIPVVSATGDPCALHQMTHRLGHTVLVLGGKAASPDDVVELVAALEALSRDSPVIEAVLGFSAGTARSGIGGMDVAVIDELGIEGVTVLVVRPDRYIGFRHDGTDPRALARYLDGFTN
jgi:hypothetical protein